MWRGAAGDGGRHRRGPGARGADDDPEVIDGNATFEAAVQFSKTEGILPAPESAHAVRVAIDEALRARESGEKKVIAFNLSGHFDMSAYEQFHQGKLQDHEYPTALVEEAMAHLPQVTVS
ncbi:MAG TPA: hypothetical protein VIJ61_04750 [Thermoanaerobaculia bacterium]